MAAAVATVPLTKVRRDVVIGLLLAQRASVGVGLALYIVLFLIELI